MLLSLLLRKYYILTWILTMNVMLRRPETANETKKKIKFLFKMTQYNTNEEADKRNKRKCAFQLYIDRSLYGCVCVWLCISKFFINFFFFFLFSRCSFWINFHFFLFPFSIYDVLITRIIRGMIKRRSNWIAHAYNLFRCIMGTLPLAERIEKNFFRSQIRAQCTWWTWTIRTANTFCLDVCTTAHSILTIPFRLQLHSFILVLLFIFCVTKKTVYATRNSFFFSFSFIMNGNEPTTNYKYFNWCWMFYFFLPFDGSTFFYLFSFHEIQFR